HRTNRRSRRGRSPQAGRIEWRNHRTAWWNGFALGVRHRLGHTPAKRTWFDDHGDHRWDHAPARSRAADRARVREAEWRAPGRIRVGFFAAGRHVRAVERHR